MRRWARAGRACSRGRGPVRGPVDPFEQGGEAPHVESVGRALAIVPVEIIQERVRHVEAVHRGEARDLDPRRYEDLGGELGDGGLPGPGARSVQRPQVLAAGRRWRTRSATCAIDSEASARSPE